MHTNKTPYIELPQFIPSDKPKMADYNEAFSKIDEQLGNKVSQSYVDGLLAAKNLKTYTSLTQIGLSGVVTMEQACEALTDGSELSIWNNTGNTNRISDAPMATVVTIKRMSANYTVCTADSAGGDVMFYKGYYRSNNTPKFSGWVQFAGAAITTSQMASIQTFALSADATEI